MIDNNLDEKVCWRGECSLLKIERKMLVLSRGISHTIYTLMVKNEQYLHLIFGQWQRTGTLLVNHKVTLFPIQDETSVFASLQNSIKVA